MNQRIQDKTFSGGLNKAAYQTLLKTLQHNLEAEYGKSSIPESKKADEEHFIYKPEENEISLFVMMRDARFYISPDYRYFPKEHQVSLKNNMQKIKETCIKQREG